MLSVEADHKSDNNVFTCRACPYQYPILKVYTERESFERKAVDDVLGGDADWDNVDQDFGTASPSPSPPGYRLTAPIYSTLP